jgi:SulP family sulfate permease
LLFLLMVVGDWVGKIPMAALVAVMIMVSIGTFSWSSITDLRVHPKSTSLVMLSTVAIVVFTHNLALGVFIGVLMSSLFFARKVAMYMSVESVLSKDKNTRTYTVYGQVFFASAEKFSAFFDYKEVIDHVTIDVSHAHFWDLSAVGALDKVVLKFRREGTQVKLLGMNEASATIVDKLAVHDKPDAMDVIATH